MSERVSNKEARERIDNCRCRHDPYHFDAHPTPGIHCKDCDALRDLLDARRERDEAREVLRKIGRWRMDCYDYDDDISGGDMDQRRPFLDTEEWDRIETYAARAAREEK